MLNLLKRLFTRDPKVELVDFQDGLISFRCSRPLALRTTQIRALLGEQKLTAEVQIQSFDSHTQLYRAKHRSGLERWVADRRQDFRLERVMRLVSPELPGFTTTTEDISAGGARINLSGPVETGKRVMVCLDLDDANLPAIRVESTVCWCARRADGSYHAGLRFDNIDAVYKSMIANFIESRRKVEI